jgi:16S rRNA (guanine527-N7)-methyltransferase
VSEEEVSAGFKLNALLAEAGQAPLNSKEEQRFKEYYSLLLRWNSRVNLTAIRDEEGILRRHFVESIVCARSLPSQIATLLDFGSGAGFPGIPIAICRPEIAVTLAESQGKKAAFLSEALRVLEIRNAKVHSRRAEELPSVFDCVTLRAVDKMEFAVRMAGKLVREGGWLALMTTREELVRLKDAIGLEYSWPEAMQPSGKDNRVLVIGQRKLNSLS